jgi:hypothetical protein
MTHRAEQIIQAAAAAIASQTDVGAAVLPHRTLSLSQDDQELPAICVRQGPDEPLQQNLAVIDSELTLKLSVYASASTEPELMAELSRLRAVVHRALLGDPTLGLTFVLGATYGGADRPEIDGGASRLAGQQDSTFAVQYRMNFTDPE